MDGSGLGMPAFLGDLAWQLSQSDHEDHSHHEQNAEHGKGDEIENVKHGFISSSGVAPAFNTS
jgi:hypothetical protein